jgi:hypothetical protein
LLIHSALAFWLNKRLIPPLSSVFVSTRSNPQRYRGLAA